MPDHPDTAIGPNVFTLMSDDESRWLSEQQRDEVALAVRRAMP